RGQPRSGAAPATAGRAPRRGGADRLGQLGLERAPSAARAAPGAGVVRGGPAAWLGAAGGRRAAPGRGELPVRRRPRAGVRQGPAGAAAVWGGGVPGGP